MRWPVALLFAYLALALELAISPALSLGQTTVSPSIVIPFVAFVAMFAPAVAAMWTSVLLGLAIDLTTSRGTTGLVIPGPHALGMLAGCYVVLQVRGLMMRRNPLTLVFLSVVAAAMCGLVVVTIFSVRGIYPDTTGFRAWPELVHRTMSALYTGVTALVLAFPLYMVHSLFRFTEPTSRRVSVRKY